MNKAKKTTSLDVAVNSALGRISIGHKVRKLVVAVSGGPDSTALVHSLVSHQNEWDLDLHVAHLDHDFRGEEAHDDATFVETMAKRLNLPYTVEQADSFEYQKLHCISSFEEASREVRYQFLGKVAARVGAQAVAVGHTADDQIETILMHIIRGSGLDGLEGMKEFSIWGCPRNNIKLQVFRPFLSVTKTNCKSYCEGLGVPYRNDSSNRMNEFTRNKVRNQLIPLLETINPAIRNSIMRLGYISSKTNEYIRSQAFIAWDKVTTVHPNGVHIDKTRFTKLDGAIQHILIRMVYKHLTGTLRKLDQKHVMAVINTINKPPGAKTNLPGGVTCVTNHDYLLVSIALLEPNVESVFNNRTMVNVYGQTTMNGWTINTELVKKPTSFTTNPLTAYMDPRVLKGPAFIKTWQPGDRFQPLGMRNEKKLQDFFVDNKIPRISRPKVPLFECNGNILWVVGYRLSDISKVRHDSAEAVKITFDKSSI